jgi:poly-beta-1,6-N-acetyl-D-glucosamine biosynthesis protein PgaD
MSDPIIIDARQHLRWYQRLASTGAALMLWAVWMWLWMPFLQRKHANNFQFEESSFELVKLASTLVAIAWLLAVWNARRQPQRVTSSALQPAPRFDLPTYAAHFGLSESDLSRSVQSATVIVHHDSAGRIVTLEPR